MHVCDWGQLRAGQHENISALTPTHLTPVVKTPAFDIAVLQESARVPAASRDLSRSLAGP